MPKPGSPVFVGIPAQVVRPWSPKAAAWAVLSSAAAFGLRLSIGYFDPSIPPFPSFFAATLITAMVAGPAAGALAAVLGLGGAWISFGSVVPSAFTMLGVAWYGVACAAIIWISEQYRGLLRRVQDREAAVERQLGVIRSENEILKRAVGEGSLSKILDQLTSAIEAYSEGRMIASMQLIDADARHLRQVAGARLPEDYRRAIDSLEIGPAVGSCGTAAFRKTPVYVADVEHDPLWADPRFAHVKSLALSHGLRSCWSVPILRGNGDLLGTFALYLRDARDPSPAEREIVELMASLAVIVIEHDRTRQKTGLLVGELRHRVKNTLSIVNSIARNTLRGKCEEAALTSLHDRLMALAKAQNLLTESQWSNIDLQDLVDDVTAFANERGQIHAEGASTTFPARLAVPMALALNELSTNALKYGALTREEGRVHIGWSLERDGATQRRLRFQWCEIDGPAVAAPARQGFGSRMIERAFASEPGCAAEIRYLATGVVCEIVVPIEDLPTGELPMPPHSLAEA